jgi:putative chitinase
MPNENELSLLRVAREAGITSREEMANFMAQMGHESGGFIRLEEGFRYTRGIDQIPVRSAWREGVHALESARLEALQGRPQDLGRLMYGNRMGNDDAGDGYLYRGRGYTQLTGESNYAIAGMALELDLITHPALAADRGNAERIALWFWQHQVPEHDRDDVSRACRAINNGENGLADRLSRYDAWHAVLTPTFIADFDAERVRAGNPVLPATGRPAMEDGALRRLETGEVRQLNDHLRAMDIRAERNRLVPEGDVFTRETEQAVRNFQEQNALPVTGRADPSTLREIDQAAEQREPQADGTRGPPDIGQSPIGQPSTGHHAESTGDRDLDRLAAALSVGDDRVASQAIAQVAESNQIRQFEQWKHEPPAEHSSQDPHQQDMHREPQVRGLSI